MTILGIVLIVAASVGIAYFLTRLEKKWYPNAWVDRETDCRK